MDEAQARSWIGANCPVSRETLDKLSAFAELVREETDRQNLVARATLDQLWERHFLDSAQLIRFAPAPISRWVDLGTGAGFPGMVVALLHPGPVTLIEERRLRVEFLRRVANEIQVDVEIIAGRVERVPPREYDVISARAFAPLPRLLEIGHHLGRKNTVWILPKGRNAKSELEALDSSWQGDFRLEPSLTDPEAQIIVAEKVARKVEREPRRNRR